uniref:Dehydration-responsive element-binding protein 3 n=1 Tax=Anthurium amnicola TaxID=1678845 RepID=A0A1D1XQP7_9ARAE
MAARAHDVAALSIKGAGVAVLNFPELAASLPRPASLSPRDVQAAAAKAAAMEPAACPRATPTPTSDELGEIVELPRLGTSFFESSELGNEFVLYESAESWASYSPPWMDSVQEEYGSFPDQAWLAAPPEAATFEALLWDY